VPFLWKWACRIALTLLALLFLSVLVGTICQKAATRNLERKHPAPGRLIDGGGHRLQLHGLWGICP
jgi:hypothetical protein